MKTKQQIQQGDVLFRRVNIETPTGKPIKPSKRGHVLADGEATGHQHVIEDVSDAELYAEGERILLHVLKQTTVTHEEHKTVTLEPGIYEIGRVQEYDYLQQMARQVRD